MNKNFDDKSAVLFYFN